MLCMINIKENDSMRRGGPKVEVVQINAMYNYSVPVI